MADPDVVLRQPPSSEERRALEAELRRLIEEWDATEQRLLEASARRIQEFERRLQYEWEALRQLHEEPIVAFEKRASALTEAWSKAVQAAEDAALREQVGSRASPVATQSENQRWPTARWTPTIVAGLMVPAVIIAFLAGRWASGGGDASRRALAAEQQAIQAQALARRESAAANQSVQRLTADAIAASTSAGRIANILAASDLHRFELLPRRVAPGAGGQALWSPSRGVVISSVRVPPPPPEERYQAWLVTTRGSIGLGMVSPDGQGRISAVFDTPPEPAGTVAGVLLTLEPPAGSASPSDRVVLGP